MEIDMLGTEQTALLDVAGDSINSAPEKKPSFSLVRFFKNICQRAKIKQRPSNYGSIIDASDAELAGERKIGCFNFGKKH
jgi:hypothetical protein